MAALQNIPSFKFTYPCVQPFFKICAVSSACFSPKISICPQSISRVAAMHNHGDEFTSSNTLENISKAKQFDKVKDQVLTELDIVFARLKARALNTSDADYSKNLSRIEGELKHIISRLGYTTPENMFNGRIVRHFLNPLPDKIPSWFGPAIAAAGLLSLALALTSWRTHHPHHRAGLQNGSPPMTIEVSTRDDKTRNQDISKKHRF